MEGSLYFKDQVTKEIIEAKLNRFNLELEDSYLINYYPQKKLVERVFPKLDNIVQTPDKLIQEKKIN